ncbi:hypothetical protein ACJX0J_041352, partial [Zea mays]
DPIYDVIGMLTHLDGKKSELPEKCPHTLPNHMREHNLGASSTWMEIYRISVAPQKGVLMILVMSDFLLGLTLL